MRLFIADSFRAALVPAIAATLAAAVSCSSGANPKPAHAPANHREAASPCPAERGLGLPRGSCLGSVIAQCTSDGDCTAGVNGRCLRSVGPACNTGCTFDECTSDSDCPGTAPCACRPSPSDSAANTCATASNCRTDADCGAGGYCSRTTIPEFCNCPSVCHSDAGDFQCGDNCGHGYFCHTSKDTCADDTDCANGGACNFDLTTQSWKCGGYMCPS